MRSRVLLLAVGVVPPSRPIRRGRFSTMGGSRRCRVALTVLALALGGLSSTSSAYAADGDLDPTFSGDGKQTSDAGGASDVAVQPDGKIVAVGAGIIRYNPDGSLDTSFAGDGKQTTDFGTSAVALQADGKIVVAGSLFLSLFPADADFALARYNTDGSPDTTFSGDGKLTTDLGGLDAAAEVALQADGKIVAGGGSGTPNDSSEAEFALARYNPDGTLDTSLSGDGKQTTDFGAGLDYGNGVALQADGKIVVGGVAIPEGSDGDFALVRYDADGSLDTTFSGDGKQTTDFGSGDSARDVVLQADGKIVAVGDSSTPSFDFALARYTASGSLDSSFSSDGKQTTDLGNQDFIFEAAVQPDGKIVAVGGTEHFVGQQLFSDFALARYNPEGLLDLSFSSDGKQTTDLGDEFDEASGVALQSGGKIVAAGVSRGASSDAGNFALARYQGGSPPPGTGGSPPPGTTAPPAPQFQPSPEPFIAPPSAATDPPGIGGPSSAGTLAVSSKGLFTLRRHAIDCTGPGPDCAAKTSVTGSLPASTASSSARRKAVKLGGSSFKVKAGQRGKVKVKLTRKGFKLLNRLKGIKAKVTITARRGAISKKKTVKVTLKAPKKKKKK